MRVVDLAGEFREKKEYSTVTLPLKLKIENSLRNGEQAIVFVNQRGFSRYVFCPLCGKPFKCRNCDITLTFHRSRKAYLCHYCGFSRSAVETCPECGFTGMKKGGAGTEKLHHELCSLFPNSTVHRVDSDSMRGKSSYRDVLTRFARNEIQVLVGTQIVAKGLDFPNVTTVGIVAIESILNLPDFRSPERTFQMISQVSGRAGRGNRKGTVMVEVFNAQHYAIQAAVAHDPDAFYEREMELRKELNYPPFGSLVRILVQGPDRRRTESHAFKLKGFVRKSGLTAKIDLLGPVEAPLARIKNKFRYHMILKVPGRIPAKGLFTDTDIFTDKGPVSVTVDVDPVSML